MSFLHIDIETFSDIDLVKCGVYRYVDSPVFTILLFAYAYDDDLVEVIDLTKDKIPDFIIKDLFSDKIVKVAHNATFERVCLSKYLNKKLPIEQWICTAIMASYLGLPRSLSDVCKALELEDEESKTSGTLLINYFSKPCKPSASNGYRERNLPEHNPEKWKQYISYNGQDVVAEREVHNRLLKYPFNDEIWRDYHIDQIINDKGVMVDILMIHTILSYSNTYKNNLLKEATEISGLSNPGSVQQAKKWLANKGYELDAFNKDVVSELLSDLKKENNDENKKVIRFLKIRQELGKTSVSKYEAMERAFINSDGRVKGILLFYGANRTGRWAGRIIQPQNLPANRLTDLDFARNLILNGEMEVAEFCYPSLMNLYSQLIRTAIVAPENHTFLVADYSSIEARILAWLANEKWVIDVFKTHGKIYEKTAAEMYNVPIESITHGSELRKKGKIACLACGYQGAEGAIAAMDSKNEIPDNERASIVKRFRDANPRIVEFWYSTEDNAKEAIRNPGVLIKGPKGIAFKMIKDSLFIQLPSKRCLVYKNARIKKSNGREQICYYGSDLNNRMGDVYSYGGKLVENITQAVARDVLAEAIYRLHVNNLTPSFHVHDEVVIEVPDDKADELMLKATDIMRLEGLKWLDSDLILKAEAFTSKYYKKD